MAPPTVAKRPDTQAPTPTSAALSDNAIYARVSTVEQADEGISLDAQEAELRALIESRYPDERITLYREEGKSARGGKKRPQYDDLCAAITAGRVRRVFAVELSRLTRDVSEWLHLRKLCADHGVHLETVNGGVEDTSSAAGKLLGTMIAALAEFESDLKSERVGRATGYLLGARQEPRPRSLRTQPPP
jgi:site-specific DNA recombinase